MNEAPDEAIDAAMRLALARAKRQFDDDGLRLVRARLARQTELSDQLRRVPLANGDEPAHGFDPLLGTAPSHEEPPS